VDGPDPQRENSPSYVDTAIALGHMVEVDLHRIGANWFLGHDYPQYQVSSGWIEARHQLLLHLKSAAALAEVTASHPHWHYFCHRSDSYTITSQNYVWLHDLTLRATPKTIVPLLSKELLLSYPGRDLVYAICSDYCS